MNDDPALLAWLGIISLTTFIVSLLALPWLVALIPEDYFLHKKREPAVSTKNPGLRLGFLLAKNLLGTVLLIGGILMLFLPGQGLLTIAIAMLLLDYPGKYKLEQRLAAKPLIFNGINWLRAKARKPPLKKPAILR